MKFESAKVTIALAVGLVLVLTGLLAERFGARADVVRTVIFLVIGGLLVFAGLGARTMRPGAEFSADGQLGGVAVAALVVPALWAVADALAVRSPLVSPRVLAVSATALLLGTVLANSQPVTVPEQIVQRFGRFLASMIALAAGLSLLVLVALIGPKVVRGLAPVLQLAPATAQRTALFLVLTTGVVGGISGIAAVSLFVVVLALVLWAAPLVVVGLRGGWAGVTAALEAAATGPALQFTQTVPVLEASGLVLAATGGLFLLNLGGLSANVQGARRGSAYAVLLCVALPVLSGLVWPLGAGDPVLATVTRSGLPGALAAMHVLVAPCLVLAGFALLAHGAAQWLTQETFFRLLVPRATSSARLAVQRLGFAAIAYAGLYAVLPEEMTGTQALGAALFVFAAGLLPLALLARMSRADWKTALCAMTSAACIAVAAVTGYIVRDYTLLAGFLAALASGLLAIRLLGPRS